MPVSVNKIIRELTPAKRKKVEDCAARLIADEMSRRSVRKPGNKHMGSSIDDFLKEEGVLEGTQAQAAKEVVTWQLAEAMKKKKASKKQNDRATQGEPQRRSVR
jgi:hypothetical protein